jgi:rubredoxin
MAAIPADVTLTCPRCKQLRTFIDVNGATQYRCSGCEWLFNLTTIAPTGTTNASRAPGTNTLPVASGGASFTNNMTLLVDTSTNAEVVQVNGTSTATSIPVAGQWTGETRDGLAKNHASGITFGQLALVPVAGGVGQQAVPANPGWGF